MKISTLLILALGGGIGYMLIDGSAKQEAEEKLRAGQEAKLAQIRAELEQAKMRQAQGAPATPPRTPFRIHWRNPLDRSAHHSKTATPIPP